MKNRFSQYHVNLANFFLREQLRPRIIDDEVPNWIFNGESPINQVSVKLRTVSEKYGNSSVYSAETQTSPLKTDRARFASIRNVGCIGFSFSLSSRHRDLEGPIASFSNSDKRRAVCRHSSRFKAAKSHDCHRKNRHRESWPT